VLPFLQLRDGYGYVPPSWQLRGVSGSVRLFGQVSFVSMPSSHLLQSRRVQRSRTLAITLACSDLRCSG